MLNTNETCFCLSDSVLQLPLREISFLLRHFFDHVSNVYLNECLQFEVGRRTDGFVKDLTHSTHLQL